MVLACRAPDRRRPAQLGLVPSFPARRAPACRLKLPPCSVASAYHGLQRLAGRILQAILSGYCQQEAPPALSRICTALLAGSCIPVPRESDARGVCASSFSSTAGCCAARRGTAGGRPGWHCGRRVSRRAPPVLPGQLSPLIAGTSRFCRQRGCADARTRRHSARHLWQAGPGAKLAQCSDPCPILSTAGSSPPSYTWHHRTLCTAASCCIVRNLYLHRPSPSLPACTALRCSPGAILRRTQPPPPLAPCSCARSGQLPRLCRSHVQVLHLWRVVGVRRAAALVCTATWWSAPAAACCKARPCTSLAARAVWSLAALLLPACPTCISSFSAASNPSSPSDSEPPSAACAL